MENIQEINFGGSIYGEIIRLARNNFEESYQRYNFQTESDLGYESGNESDTEITNEPDAENTNSETSKNV